MGRLHAGDEANGPSVDDGEEKMVVVAREGLPRPGLCRNSVEEVRSGVNDLVVAGTEAHNSHGYVRSSVRASSTIVSRAWRCERPCSRRSRR
jgi:hypothetical protein